MPFTPATTPYVWLDANAITGLSDGDKVASWPDLSGAGLHFAQGTDANRPVYKTGILAGRPVVRFTAANATTLTSSATLANATAFTILAVHTRTASNPAFGQMLRSSGGTNGVQLVYSTADTLNRLVVTGNVVRGFTDSSTGVRIQSWRYKGSVPSAEAWRDGVAQTLASNGTLPSAISAIAGTLQLGGASTTYWDGDVAELVIVASALSDDELAAWHVWLTAKWEGLLLEPTALDVAVTAPAATLAGSGSAPLFITAQDVIATLPAPTLAGSGTAALALIENTGIPVTVTLPAATLIGPVWKAVIGGVTHTSDLAQIAGGQIQWTINERTTAAFRTVPSASFFLPDQGDDVLIYDQDGVTVLFGGTVLTRRCEADGALGWATLTCVGYEALLDAVWFTGSYTGTTSIADILDDVVDAASSLGFTLSPFQGFVGNVTVDIAWANARCSDVIRDLCDLAGSHFVTVDPSKVVRMRAVRATACAWSVTDADAHCEQLAWEDHESQAYTDVVLLCGSGQSQRTQAWAQAGSATSWVADVPAAPGAVPPGSVDVGGVTKTVGTGAQYTWDPLTATLAKGTDTTPANGTVITLIYTAQYPFEATATTSGTPVMTLRETRTDVMEPGLGAALAAQRLAQVNAEASARRVEVGSAQSGLSVGCELDVWSDILQLGAEGDAAIVLIESLTLNIHTDTHWTWDASGTTAEIPSTSYLREFRH